jgi:hypothetical protein
VQHAHRELVLESAQTPADVVDAVTKALADSSGILELVDEKGKRVIVPAGKLAYVEIADTTSRPVGFVAS